MRVRYLLLSSLLHRSPVGIWLDDVEGKILNERDLAEFSRALLRHQSPAFGARGSNEVKGEKRTNTARRRWMAVEPRSGDGGTAIWVWRAQFEANVGSDDIKKLIEAWRVAGGGKAEYNHRRCA